MQDGDRWCPLLSALDLDLWRVIINVFWPESYTIYRNTYCIYSMYM